MNPENKSRPLTIPIACAIARLPTGAIAQQHNATPAEDNPYNTPIERSARSPGFRCGVTVDSIWTSGADDAYAAFSDDRNWYRVPHSGMQPLLYTAYSLGRKVCYQTKGYPTEDIAINIVFFDPLN
ncbi:hypothetical protein [Luteibacter sp. 3190]|uniref:hypothetical protein n=1 Tax=Luteibacter sp. 3190 TaxID=2817736 RepID=UPI00286794A8|nr:hypothetical protein [Luteibacter sp. 3190]MDR6937032.1 hypothetical protein [Luteibacter sp. 3190]